MAGRYRFSVALVGAITLLTASAGVAPATATGTTTVSESGPATDPAATRDGVDYDAACVASAAPSKPAANGYASPDSSPTPGCPGVSGYDAVTESTDIASATLESLANGRLRATIVVDGPVPGAGAAQFDGPNGGEVGARWHVMYQNKDKLTNGDNTASGCTDVFGRRKHDQHGHWADGYHFFVGFGVDLVSGSWVRRAHVGKYDPSPDGGFRTTVLGTDSGGGWATADPAMAGRWSASVTAAGGSTTIVVEVTGLVRASNPLCLSGIFTTDYGSTNPGPYSGAGYAGDRIHEVKGLSTVLFTAGPKPGASACGVDSDDACTGGTWATPERELISDTTEGNSTAGGNGTNTPGIAYTLGADPSKDTTGNGSTCPTPTFGGTFTPNSGWSVSQNLPCQIDDDSTGRGTLYAEFWETAADFTF